jgi:glycosyltransferase involved in cell wall biosynthesis
MKLLFLSRWLPYPANNGSKLRVYNLIKNLAKRGYEIHLISFYELGEDPELAGQPLSQYCASLETVLYKPFRPTSWQGRLAFFSPKPRWAKTTFQAEMARLVKASLASQNIEALLASQIDMAGYGGIAIKYRVPALLEELELSTFHERYGRASSPKQRLRNGLTWLKMAAYVRSLARKYAAITVVSEKEQALVSKVVRRTPLISLPNGADLQTYTFHPYQAGQRRNRLIFNGALTFNLNYEAMDYFLNEIFPLIRQKEPHLELLITGRCENLDPLKLVQGQAARLDGVNFSGYLEDIGPAVADSRACIVPLLQGGGTRLKILEAFALGTPVIATAKGAEGLAVQPGQDLLVANTPTEFAQAVLGLLTDPVLAANLAVNARKLVETYYNWDRITGQLDALLQDLRSRAQAGRG